MVSTDEGIYTEVRPVPRKAFAPMDVTPGEMVAEVSEWHAEKAFCPMVFTDGEM